jgi:hypothetical protein
MPAEKAVQALRDHAVQLSQLKQQAVRDAIATLVNSRSPVNVSTVSRTASVSREFIYSHDVLRDAVREAASLSFQPTALSNGTSVEGHLIAGLRAERSTLLDQVKRQKTAIAEQQLQLAELRKQQQRWLGVQLEAMEAVDPQAHAELRITNDRLMAENTALTRQVQELRRLVTILEGDLAASRQAHMEDVVAFTSDEANVVAISHS